MNLYILVVAILLWMIVGTLIILSILDLYNLWKNNRECKNKINDLKEGKKNRVLYPILFIALLYIIYV